MNNGFYDTTKYECCICKHRWIITSDKLLTDEQVDNWLRESILEHVIIHRERNNNV